jgi:putative transposase
MIIRKAYKYQLKISSSTKPDLEQKLASFAGCRRFVWNKALAMQKERLDTKQKSFTYGELASQLILWKKEPETAFLTACHSQVLQQTLKQLDLALRNGFKKTAIQKFPTFKKKSFNDGFMFPQGFKLDMANKRVFLPKIGYVNLRVDRELVGKAKNVTISKTAGKWYISIQVEQELNQLPRHTATSAIGVDLGIVQTVTTTDTKAELAVFKPLDLAKPQHKIKCLQRQLAKKTKFGKNWQKIKAKINKQHNQISNKRKNHLHTISHKLSKNHAMIVVEDLKIANMVKSAKGSKQKHGKNVKQKSGLNRSILAQGWGELIRQIEYKQEWQGGIVLKVNSKYTSQKCSNCGNIHKNNRQTQSKFICQSCGHIDHADFNAAKNILAAGLAVLACGEHVRPIDDMHNNVSQLKANSVKQEPSMSFN